MQKETFFMKHPYLAGVILPCAGYIWLSICYLIAGVAATPAGNAGLDEELAVTVLVWFLCPLVLLFQKRIYRPSFKGYFRREGLKDQRVWIAMLLFLACKIIFHIYSGFKNGFYTPTIDCLTNGMTAGILEEVIFRALPIPVMMVYFKQKGTSWPVLYFTSAVFGLIHLTNLSAGSAIPVTILQVFTAASMGMMLGAFFLRSGNLLFPILAHSMHDFFAFWANGSANAVLTFDIGLSEVVEEIIMMAACIGIGIYLMKDEKTEVIPVWEERWSGQ